MALGSAADAAWARYWLAFAHYLADNAAESQGILLQLLAEERAGLQVAPDFRFRLLTALGNTEAWDGRPERALTYMEEARSLLGDVSLRQRAAFLSGLSLQLPACRRPRGLAARRPREPGPVPAGRCGTRGGRAGGQPGHHLPRAGQQQEGDIAPATGAPAGGAPCRCAAPVGGGRSRSPGRAGGR